MSQRILVTHYALLTTRRSIGLDPMPVLLGESRSLIATLSLAKRFLQAERHLWVERWTFRSDGWPATRTAIRRWTGSEAESIVVKIK